MRSTSCRVPQFCKVQVNLYSLNGLYSLYRASVLVQYSYNSTHHLGRTGFTVPQCLYSTAITLLLQCAIKLLQIFRTCILQLYLHSRYCPYRLYKASELVDYNFSSISPVVRAAFTEPQAL